MKRYLIGLTLLFALMNTGCEDAKAESVDNSDEITQLQKQITELKSRVDTLFASIPKTYFFEGQIASNGTFKVEHPSIKPNNLPLIHYQFEFNEQTLNNGNSFWGLYPDGHTGHQFQGIHVHDGYLIIKNTWQGNSIPNYVGRKVKIQLTTLN